LASDGCVVHQYDPASERLTAVSLLLRCFAAALALSAGSAFAAPTISAADHDINWGAGRNKSSISARLGVSPMQIRP
jgi:hypothetical protein